MLANAAGVMPDSLIFKADQQFFERGLDGVDAVVHGRHSHERQPRSHLRPRLVVTRQVAATAADPSNDQALFWNPAGTSFEQALATLGVVGGSVAIIGGTNVFGMFLGQYDSFYLTRVPNVCLPGGRPVFPGVPLQTPEDLLTSNGLRSGPRQVLDAANDLAMVAWQRARNDLP